MEYREWLKQLKTGDEVIVSCWNYGTTYRKEKVEKVTPTGLIRVDGILYKPHNGLSRSEYSQLHDPNDEKTIKTVQEWKENNFVLRVLNKFRSIDYNTVTYEQAVEICKIMGWGTESE